MESQTDVADENGVAKKADASGRDSETRQYLTRGAALFRTKGDNETRDKQENDTKNSSLGGDRIGRTFINERCYEKRWPKEKFEVRQANYNMSSHGEIHGKTHSHTQYSPQQRDEHRRKAGFPRRGDRESTIIQGQAGHERGGHGT